MTSFYSRLIFVAFTIKLALAAAPAWADDQFLVLGGNNSLEHANPGQTSDTWQIEYMQGVNENFSYSLDHVNQGAFNQGISHHPDYDGANIWLHADLFDQRLRLAAGTGLLYYYDTIGSSFGQGATIAHGLGADFMVAATWRVMGPLLLQARAGVVKEDGFNTQFVMFGIGYQLDAYPSMNSSDLGSQPDSALPGRVKSEITLYGGQDVINQPYNARTQAVGLEWRSNINKYMQWSVGYLDEGDSALADRRGVTAEVWLSKSFFDDRFSLAAGIGPYLAEDRKQSDFVATIRSFSAAYHISRRLTLRGTWERVITNYNRDSDIYLGGVSYCFF